MGYANSNSGSRFYYSFILGRALDGAWVGWLGRPVSKTVFFFIPPSFRFGVCHRRTEDSVRDFCASSSICSAWVREHGRCRIVQHKEMDCDVSCLHKLQKNDGRRKTHWPRQSLRKPYLRWNRWLLQLSEASFCNWGWFLCWCCVNFGFVFISTAKFDYWWITLQIDKAYPRDFMQRGRVRVLLKKEDGTLFNSTISSSKI